MGCGGSKLDDLEAVVLCRDRTRLLAEAIGCRYAMADAHAGYAKSLRSVGVSLTTFLDSLRNLPPPLQLPTERKGEDRGSVPAVLDHSSSGSHIHFHSDSEDLEGESDDGDDDDDDDFPLHSDADSPIHHHLHHKSPQLGPTVTYAKNQPPINSVSYEQRPMSPEIVHFGGGGGGGGEASSSSSSYPPPYYGYSYPPPPPPQNPNLYGADYSYGYPSNYGPYGEMGGYFGAASPPPPLAASPVAQKAAPPPPSPPRVSTWDFINPFDGYDSSYFAPYTPSRSSREVREEEGIPDLEDEENVVVKEAYGDDKSTVGSSMGSSPDSRDGDKVNGVGVEGKKEKSVDAGGPSEENVVDKNVVESKAAEMEEKQNAATLLPVKKYHDLPEVVQEVKSQFNRASESAVELAKMLEVGKQPYHQRNTVYKGEKRDNLLVN